MFYTKRLYCIHLSVLLVPPMSGLIYLFTDFVFSMPVPHDPFNVVPSRSLPMNLTIPFSLSQIVSVPLPASCLPNP